MADTGIVGPLANAAVGTGLGDGTNYGAFSNPQRLHRTSAGSNASTVTAANKGTRWYNCFDSNQIPSAATILGVELVAGVDFDGSGNSNIGSFGSTGATESITFKAFLYNGTSYSSALTYDGNTRTGITYSDSNTAATFLGANRRYLGLSTLGTLFGGPTDLSGLSWNTANQADFGFALISTAVVNTPVAGIIRGIGLKVYYSESDPVKLLNLPGTSIVRVDNVPGNTIAKWGAINFTAEAPPVVTGYESLLYSFENQSTNTGTGDWSVSAPMSDAPAWANGTSVVDGTYWGLTSNKTVKGWNLDSDSTPSGGTGPTGGATLPDGVISTSAGSDKYMYTEATSGRNAYCFVCRTGGYNFSTLMNNTSNNLDLEFFVHGYSSSGQMGDLFVYIDTATTSNNASATLLDSQTSFAQASDSSNYTKITVSLNSYRTVNSDHYIYFVSQNGTGFRSDLAVDLVQIKETL
jgi:hypothetical protein